MQLVRIVIQEQQIQEYHFKVILVTTLLITLRQNYLGELLNVVEPIDDVDVKDFGEGVEEAVVDEQVVLFVEVAVEEQEVGLGVPIVEV